MNHNQALCDPPGDGKAVEDIANDVEMIRQIPDLLVHVKGLRKEVDNMTVLPLVLEIVPDVDREVLKVPVIPHKAHFIHQDQGVGREANLTKIIRVKLINAGDLPVTEDRPALFLVLDRQLGHESGLARAFLSKDHIELIGIAVLYKVIRKKKEQKKGRKLKDNQAF